MMGGLQVLKAEVGQSSRTQLDDSMVCSGSLYTMESQTVIQHISYGTGKTFSFSSMSNFTKFTSVICCTVFVGFIAILGTRSKGNHPSTVARMCMTIAMVPMIS